MITQSTTQDPESQEWPEIITRRQQERPDDTVRDPSKLVNTTKGLAWEPRRVKGTKSRAGLAPRISEEDVTQALDDASKMEMEYDPEELKRMEELYDRTIQAIKEGEIIKGTVLAITDDDVIVDVGFKSEGVISRSEFPADANIQPGSEVEVFLESMEDQKGQLVLSKQKADFMRVWDRIKEASEEKQLVRGRLVRRIKGGVVVDLFGAEAFLPGSQIALRQIADFDDLLGTEMEFKIIKLNKNRRNIVVSRRVVLEDERNRMRDTLLKEIEVGQVREGVVKNVTDFGVFVDLGGVDGLLHITDMSWGRIVHPSEITSVGSTINVKVLDFNPETTRISLGLKQLEPYPWENIEERYPIGARINGKIVSVTDYGAFIRLEKGIEGLIHVSEMSWTQHVKHPSKVVKPGDVVEAVVLSIDAKNEKISLGIKQLQPDPWSVVDINFPIHTEVEGKVRNLTAFGAFVELDDGIDGLVHISDMSWTERLQHPNEVVKKGDTVKVRVLAIDKDSRRISLGMKQLEEDPWPSFTAIYPVGMDKEEAQIVRLMDRGLVVTIDPKIEAFVPINSLGVPGLKKPEEAFKVGEKLPVRIVEVDKSARKIVVSVSDYLKAKEDDELKQYLSDHPITTIKLADVVEGKPEVASEKDSSSASADTDVGEGKTAVDSEKDSSSADQEPDSEATQKIDITAISEGGAESDGDAEVAKDGDGAGGEEGTSDTDSAEEGVPEDKSEKAAE